MAGSENLPNNNNIALNHFAFYQLIEKASEPQRSHSSSEPIGSLRVFNSLFPVRVTMTVNRE